MKAWKGVVITTYQEVLTVLADTKEKAELLMYDRANPIGDGVSGETEVYDLKEIGVSVLNEDGIDENYEQEVLDIEEE